VCACVETEKGQFAHRYFASQHISEAGTVIILRYRSITLNGLRLNLRPILLVEIAILPRQQTAQTQSKYRREEHECCTDRHTLDETRGLLVREHISAQERTALADYVKQDDAPTTAGIRALVVWER
jgi:hypothetical protein